MSKIFEYELTKKREDLLEQARRIAEGYGAHFEIKNDYGKFNWNGIKGSLRISNKKLIITILDKPFIIPWGMVEKTIRQFFTQAGRKLA